MKSSENIKKQIRYVQRIEILLVFSAVLANCGKPASNETIINSKGSAQTLNCDNNDCDPAVDPKIQAGIRAEGSAIVESCSQKLDSGKKLTTFHGAGIEGYLMETKEVFKVIEGELIRVVASFSD